MKKITAIMLAFLMIVSIVPMSAMAATVDVDLSKSSTDYYSVVEKNDYVLASGATETEFVLNNDEGTHRQVVHAVEVDLANPNISVMPTYKGISEDIDLYDESNWGTQIMSEQLAHIEEDLGLNVVAGMNVALSWNFDHPFGLLIYKGKVLYDDRDKLNEDGTPYYANKGGYAAPLFVIKKDGTAEFRDFHSKLTGDEWMAQVVCMTWLVKDGVNLYEPEDHTSVGAGRSVIGIKEDGSLIIMQNDGRQAPYSTGFTPYEMSEMMISLGCVQAVNCDGGGSSTFLSKRAGETELSIKSRPSDGSERATINGIAVISNAVSDGVLSSVVVTAKKTSIAPGGKVTLKALGVDAAGGPAELPENLEFVVEDEELGSIVDGEFVSSGKFGSAVINAVIDGKIYGSITINIQAPEKIRFEDDAVEYFVKNETAGRRVELPVMGYIGNKPIEVSTDDVTLSCDPQDGTVEGFEVIPNSTYAGGKEVIVTATLNADPSVKATVKLQVYSISEIDFDFDNAEYSNYQERITETKTQTTTVSWCTKCNKEAGTTCKLLHRKYLENRTTEKTTTTVIQEGVEKSLAWNRDMEDATEDTVNSSYVVTSDPKKNDFTLEYTFGIDIRKVSLPNGSDTILGLVDSEGNYESAWDAMCSLAPRITTDTLITFKIPVDKKLKVDAREIFIVSDCFEIASATVDSNNVLTVSVKWKVQYTALDPNTENPKIVCGGVKVSAPGLERNQNYSFDVSGQLNYHMCMLTSTGYKYAWMLSGMGGGAYEKSPEAQSGQNASQGIYMDQTKVVTFKDKFTLDTTWKTDVWVGDYYYVNNKVFKNDVRYIVAKDGSNAYYYYSFDENGNASLYNGRLEHDDKMCDIVNGVPTPVAILFENGFYYVDGELATGVYRLPEVDVEKPTEELCYKIQDGKIVSTFTGLYNDDGTYRYSYLGRYAAGWQMIKGDWYYFDETTLAAVSGEYVYKKFPHITYYLERNGKLSYGVWYEDQAGTRYYYGPSCINKGLKEIDGKQYYFFDGLLCETGIYYMELATGNGRTFYEIDKNNEFVGKYEKNGLVECADGLYYNIDGEPQTGLFNVDGDYYYFNIQYKAVKDCKYKVSNRNGITDLPYGEYEFDSEGKLIHKNGVYVSGSNYYYYENSKKTNAGLVKIGDDYYYSKDNGLIAVNGTYTVTKTSCDLPAGEKYKFGSDGKMLNGLVDEGKYTFYYENGKRVKAGIVEIDGDYYYIDDNCLPKTNGTYTIRKSTVAEIPIGTKCKFDADGKMYNGVYEEGTSGNRYYYEFGKRVEAGIVESNGEYYYARTGGLCARNGTYTVTKTSVAGVEIGDKCRVHDDARVYHGIENVNGNLYYYNLGKRVNAGLVKVDDDYYYSRENGLIAVNGTYTVTYTSCDLSAGEKYKFGVDGKMLQGVVAEGTAGNSYYYINGKRVAAGLVEFNGDIYYAKANGLIAKNGAYTATDSTIEGLETGLVYKFDLEGKAYQGLVDEGKNTYYYENGRRVNAGLVKVGEDYYCVNKSGIVIKGEEATPTITSCDLPAGVGIKYSFGADGKMLQGIVDGYYYNNGQKTYAGLVKIGEDYYYIGKDFKPVCGKSQFAIIVNCDLTGGVSYTFDAEGKLVK